MTLKLALTVIQVLCALVLIAVVMLQSGKSAGLSGAIAGGVDTFLSKNKAKTWDSKLAKMTKWRSEKTTMKNVSETFVRFTFDSLEKV